MTIGANNVEWFEWSGTKQDAIALQKRYLETVNVLVPVSAESYAKRAAAYFMVYGVPKAGDRDHRPSSFGRPWDGAEIELYKAALLWLAWREHLPNTGQKVEDVFVGKALAVKFDGDKDLTRVARPTLRFEQSIHDDGRHTREALWARPEEGRQHAGGRPLCHCWQSVGPQRRDLRATYSNRCG